MNLRELQPATRMYAVYAAYGQAMIYAHALEKRMEALVVAHVEEASISSPARTAEIERVHRLTLGQLIEEFVHRYNPTEGLEEELSNILFVRNELAHSIAATVLSAARETKWEVQLIEELTQYTILFREAGEHLRPHIADWFAGHRIDELALKSSALELYPGVANELPRSAEPC